MSPLGTAVIQLRRPGLGTPRHLLVNSYQVSELVEEQTQSRASDFKCRSRRMTHGVRIHGPAVVRNCPGRK